jgi:hypothetical protein
MRSLFPSAAALALILVVFTASAAPIAYSEAVSGDLPNTGVLPTFTLDFGINTISGTYGQDANENDDFDGFAIIVPSGLSVLFGDITLTDNTGDMITATWRLSSGSNLANGGTPIADLTTNSPGTTVIPVLVADTYNFTQAGFTNTPEVSETGNYTFTFVVPEPASLALFSMAPVVLLRRSRKAKSE